MNEGLSTEFDVSESDVSQPDVSQPDVSQPDVSQHGTSNKIKKSNKVVPEMNGLFIAVTETNVIEEPLLDERIVEITDNEAEHDIENIIEDTSVLLENSDIKTNQLETNNNENIVENNSNSPSDYVPSDNIQEKSILGNSISLDISESNINDADIGDPILENPPNNYEEYSIKELKNILEEMGLSTSGNKNKLIERIVSHKK